MTNQELHDKLSQYFYAAKQYGLITAELQEAFDTVHDSIWDSNVEVSAAAKQSLKDVVGDWEME